VTRWLCPFCDMNLSCQILYPWFLLHAVILRYINARCTDNRSLYTALAAEEVALELGIMTLGIVCVQRSSYLLRQVAALDLALAR
jgi:hypothetical protein